MDVVLLNSQTCLTECSQIDAFHCRLFHGVTERGGRSPTNKDYRLAHSVDHPLKLHRNVWNIPDVFEVSLCLVVSEKVKTEILSVDQIEFEQVEFARTFSIPYEKGDFSHFERIGHYDEQMAYISSQNHDPSLLSSLDSFYELKCPRLQNVLSEFTSASNLVQIELEGFDTDDLAEIEICPEMLDRFPILQYGSIRIFRKDVFEKIQNYVSRDFFCVGQLKHK